VDTAPDLVRVTNEIIATRGHGPTDFKRNRRFVGYGSRRMIVDALAQHGDQADSQSLDSLQRDFLTRYADTIDQLSRPFSGVIDTLDLLASLGAELSVCTNKPGYLARPLLDKLDMTEHFTRIIGGDEVPRAKPDPRHIFHAAGHRESARIVMVGDSYPDMRAAHNARAHAILVNFGYSPIDQKRLRADTRISRFRDIVPALISHYS